MKKLILKLLFVGSALLCLFPFVSSAVALIAGILFTILLGNPFFEQVKKSIPRLLQISVVGLAGGMNLAVVLDAGVHGLLYTIIGITLTLAMGMIIGRLFKNERSTSILVSVGTAICGGSAIAAVGSSIRAKSEAMSLSLVTVFFLNAIGLLIFPTIGRWFGLDEIQFGYWSALSIHDTSSVVGASMAYGPRALELATIIKLTRTIWIIPLTIGFGIYFGRGGSEGTRGKRTYPWFILWFLVVAALVTWIEPLRSIGFNIQEISKRALVLTLFLIGSSIPKSSFKDLQLLRVVAQGTLLWLIVAAGTLGAIHMKWIS